MARLEPAMIFRIVSRVAFERFRTDPRAGIRLPAELVEDLLVVGRTRPAEAGHDG